MSKVTFVLIIFFLSVSALSAQNVGTMVDDTIVNYIDINKKKQGKWIKYYDSGQVRYKGYFINDIPKGTFMFYHPNGKVKSVLNYDDKGCSTAELFWDNGKRAAKGTYDENNERDKIWYIYFEDEILSAFITYNHGIAHGIVKMYYPGSGKKVLECEYKDGKLDGYYKKFFESGITIEEGPYVKGARHGYWKFYSTGGIVEEEGNYVNGERDGDWLVYTKVPTGDTINYQMGTPDNYDEVMKEWQDKQTWAKEHQDQFRQPEDYLDNPIDFFKPSTNPNTQLK